MNDHANGWRSGRCERSACAVGRLREALGLSWGWCWCALVEFDEKRVDDAWVELAASTAAGLRARVRSAYSRRIGPTGDHCVERVAGEHDPRGQRDLLAAEPVGVAGTVVALGRRSHELRHGLQCGCGIQYSFADQRVVANERPLGVAQRGDFAQNALGDRELADIVQLARTQREFDRFRIESKPARDVARELADLEHVLRELAECSAVARSSTSRV